MARLQDFQTVTPSASDKLLVVQSQSQGLVPYGSKLDSANPTGTGSLSLNRKSGTDTGNYSVAEGVNCESSGVASHGEGQATAAKGNMAHSEGYGTIAKNRSQHVFGEYNVQDPSSAASGSKGTYIEIVGKGSSDANRSNARTLDWNGNEVLAGGLKLNGNDEVVSTVYSHSNWANTHSFVVKKPATYLLFTDSGNDMAKLKIFTDNVAQLNAMLGSNIQSVSLDTSTMTVTVTVNNRGLCAIRLM